MYFVTAPLLQQPKEEIILFKAMLEKFKHHDK